ncbi:MAG: NADAR family protein [Eubacterium sp.]|nr:NADAR family protein [Eubacterium sp.]
MRNVIGFHNPDEAYGYLSNWYLSDFSIEGIKFSSMEQYMMYKKAILFNDTEIASQIMETSNVGKIKALGRSVSNYNDTVWNGMRQPIIYKGLIEKFKQNDELKKKLLDTGNDILAECAVQDKIWGIGLSMTDPNKNDMTKWRGQNLLGFSLMLVRDELKVF